MGWELAIWAASAVIAIAAATLAARRQPRPEDERSHEESPTEDRREAHYMRNFWNYDGGEQEEFDG